MGITVVETGGWGGIGHYAHCLCSALQNAGEPVRLLTHARNYALESLPKSYEVVKIFQGDGFFSDWKRLYATWKKQPNEIVHFQSLLSTRRDWLMFWFARYFSPRTKLILTSHNVLPHEILPGEKKAYRLLYKRVAGLIVHSEASRNTLRSLMGPNVKTPVTVIPHGHYGDLVRADDLTRTAALDQLGLPPNRYIVFFGAIRPYKGVDALLQAIGGLSEWPTDLRVLIAGKLMAGVSKKELYRLRDELGIHERVILKLDYLPESSIPAIFAIADLIVLPYRKIDQSGILMAAIAAGRPVLCTPVGGFPEVVNSDIGFLAEDSSVPSLTEALAQALRQRHVWADMGSEALRTARLNYSWSDIAKKTLRFYKSLEIHQDL
jgi:glycosyltransferase involved in cell wall biosynthesis